MTIVFMNNQKLLGARIKEIRRKKGFTQEKLAELVGLETGSLSSIESGRNFPSLVTLDKISKVLNIELKSFFDFSHLQEIPKLKNHFLGLIDEMSDEQIRTLCKFTEAIVI